MSTGYVHRTAICEHCGRYDEQFICTSLTTFSSVIRIGEGEIGWVPTVTSWTEWKARLLAHGTITASIVDEYGMEHPVDTFIREVEATAPEHRRRQYEWTRARQRPSDQIHTTDGPEINGVWLDADGFTFCGYGFTS